MHLVASAVQGLAANTLYAFASAWAVPTPLHHSCCQLQPARQALVAAAECYGTLHAAASEFACMSMFLPLPGHTAGPGVLVVLLHGEAPEAASTSSTGMLHYPTINCAHMLCTAAALQIFKVLSATGQSCSSCCHQAHVTNLGLLQLQISVPCCGVATLHQTLLGTKPNSLSCC